MQTSFTRLHLPSSVVVHPALRTCLNVSVTRSRLRLSFRSELDCGRLFLLAIFARRDAPSFAPGDGTPCGNRVPWVPVERWGGGRVPLHGVGPVRIELPFFGGVSQLVVPPLLGLRVLRPFHVVRQWGLSEPILTVGRLDETLEGDSTCQKVTGLIVAGDVVTK